MESAVAVLCLLERQLSVVSHFLQQSCLFSNSAHEIKTNS